jgi:hypothetical protein
MQAQVYLLSGFETNLFASYRAFAVAAANAIASCAWSRRCWRNFCASIGISASESNVCTNSVGAKLVAVCLLLFSCAWIYGSASVYSSTMNLIAISTVWLVLSAPPENSFPELGHEARIPIGYCRFGYRLMSLPSFPRRKRTRFVNRHVEVINVS